MKYAIRRRLERVADRRAELERMLSDPAVLGSSTRFRELSMEFSRVDPVARSLERLAGHERELAAARAMAEDPDPGIAALARQEVAALERAAASEEAELERMLVPADPLDDHNVFLEVRAAAGGDEAAIFAGDLFRMYARYAERRGWSVELVSESRGEHGGYREVISRIAGRGAYAALKFESGTHRVQRVPATESQGRIHTSTCTVAVLPEIAEVESVEINPADLRTATYRSSGAGGQHVNKTESAIRITHLPSGIVVECQDERSQHKNREKALSVLKAKIRDKQEREQQAKTASTRKSLIGSGDRSERIRTYNFPQGRVTDHRINLTLYKIDRIMEGELDEIVNALSAEQQAEQLAQLAEEAV